MFASVKISSGFSRSSIFQAKNPLPTHVPSMRLEVRYFLADITLSHSPAF